MKNKKFVIIDAMALAYRAYFAFINRPLTNSKGESTSAVYGFLNQLIKVFEDHKPDYLAVAFDSKEKTFRHEKYEAYKSSRDAMPNDMIPQLQRIKAVSYTHLDVYKRQLVFSQIFFAASTPPLLSAFLTSTINFFVLVLAFVNVYNLSKQKPNPTTNDARIGCINIPPAMYFSVSQFITPLSFVA